MTKKAKRKRPQAKLAKCYQKDTVCRCGKTFERARPWQAFCSARCRSADHRGGQLVELLAKTCEKCGRPFQQVKSWQRFCSQGCRRDFHNEGLAA